MLYKFETIISLSKNSSNEDYGQNLKYVMVIATTKDFPFNSIEKIEIYDVQNKNKIPLDTLSSFEQTNLVEEAESFVKRKKYESLY